MDQQGNENDDGPWRCELCDSEFATRKGLKTHLTRPIHLRKLTSLQLRQGSGPALDVSMGFTPSPFVVSNVSAGTPAAITFGPIHGHGVNVRVSSLSETTLCFWSKQYHTTFQPMTEVFAPPLADSSPTTSHEAQDERSLMQGQQVEQDDMDVDDAGLGYLPPPPLPAHASLLPPMHLLLTDPLPALAKPPSAVSAASESNDQPALASAVEENVDSDGEAGSEDNRGEFDESSAGADETSRLEEEEAMSPFF